MKTLILILLIFFALNTTAQTVKDFTFDSNAEGWVFTSGGKATGVYNGTEQALDINSIGRNNLDLSYWEWTGTWEDLGVPAGNTVTQLTYGFFWKCYIANISDGYTRGPFEVYNSDGTVLIDQSNGSSGSGTTSQYALQTSWVYITSGYQASNTTVKIRINITLDNGNNAAAETGIYYDDITFTIASTVGGTSRRIFIIN